MATLTQEKLQKNEDVEIPINQTAVMKSKLTEWISKAVQEMNLSRKEKIIKCYADTGILDAWSPQKNDLYEEAVEKRHSLFPNMIDQS